MRLRKYRDRNDDIINKVKTLRHNAQACISCMELQCNFYPEKENYKASIQYLYARDQY